MSLKWRSFPRQPDRPEALGLHGFITHTTKDVREMQERMLTWQLWLWKRWSRKRRLSILKHRWRRPIPTVVYKAETKSLKGWWQRSALVSRTEVGGRMSEGFGWGLSTKIDLSSATPSSAAPLLYCKLWSSYKASSGLTSPPFYHKPQLRPVATSPVRVPELSATAAPCITTQNTGRLTKGFISSDFLYGSRFAFFPWVLKFLVPPIMRSSLWHMFCSFSHFM